MKDTPTSDFRQECLSGASALFICILKFTWKPLGDKGEKIGENKIMLLQLTGGIQQSHGQECYDGNERVRISSQP